MSVLAGQLIHVGGGGVLFDRLQTAGPGQINQNKEKIYELGNRESVGLVADTADLSFSLESFDVSAELEATLVGSDFATDAAGTEYDISQARVQDIVSQIRAPKGDANPDDVIGSAVAPYLTLEQLSYRFGIRDNASQNATLRGDALHWASASAFVETVAGSGAAGQVVTFANTAIPYNGDSVAGTRYALAVTIVEDGKRLTPVSDYSETATAVTITEAVPATKTIRVVYQSLTVAQYPQAVHAPASATRPAAVRGRDIEVRLGGVTVTDRWSSIQSLNIDWRVQLDPDEELGNANIVAQDFDVAEVSGSIQIKPRDVAELITRVKQTAGVTGDESVGPYTAASLPLQVLIHSPADGSVLKTLYVEDAELTLPGFQGQVQQKLTVDFPFESLGGNLKVYKGQQP